MSQPNVGKMPVAARVVHASSGMLFVAATVVFAGIVLQRASAPTEVILKHTVIDDAVYYAVAGRNFAEGAGYTFDGLHRTNGVQPLWAMVVALLAWLVRDDVGLLRTLAALGGACWLGAGVLLNRLIGGWRQPPAVVAAVAFQCVGIEGNLSLSGMETGLTALLLAAALLQARGLGEAVDRSGGWSRRAAWFGMTMAALTLSRVEFVVLAVLWGAGVVADGLRRGLGFRSASLRSAPYVVPLLAIGGGWLGFSGAYFGEWTPISGSVKAFYTAHLPNPHGGFDGSLVHHVALAALLAMQSVAHALFEWSFVWRIDVGIATLAAVVAVVFLSPALFALSVIAASWRARAANRLAWPTAGLAAFVACHLVLVSVYLTPFTTYGSWYFAGEILSIWLAIGAAARFALSRGGLSGVIAVPALVLAFASAVQRVPRHIALVHPPTSSPGDLVEVGRWCRDWLPPGSRIGAWNAGFVSLMAKGRTVINLDGLMNDGTFFREYLVRDRLDDYVRDTGIRFLADSRPPRDWLDYARGTGPRVPAGMQPLFCRQSFPGHVMCVLAVPDAAGALPAVAPHPLARTFHRAFVLGDAASTGDVAQVPVGRQIVATYLDPVSHEPRHVHLNDADAVTAVDAAGVAVLQSPVARFAEVIDLAGAEVPRDPVAIGRPFLVTTYWRPGASSSRMGGLRVCLQIGDGQERCDRVAHGTLRFESWANDRIVAHTFVMTVEASDTAEQPLWLSVRAADGERLPCLGQRDARLRIGSLRTAP